MSWKVKRASSSTPALHVPVGVAWDDEGQRLVIPHRHLVMADGRQLSYAGPWRLEGHADGASYTLRGL